MPRPPAIPTRTCEVGIGFGFESDIDLGASIKVETSEPELVWAATGSPGIKDPVTITVDPGMDATFQLIPTDIVYDEAAGTGWLKNGAPVDTTEGKQTNYYTITVQWTKPGSLAGRAANVGAPIVYPRVVIPSGEGTIDLDKIAQYTGASGQTISIPADLLQKVTDAAEAATASAASAAAAEASAAEATAPTDSFVAARISDPASATNAALNAQYASFGTDLDAFLDALPSGAVYAYTLLSPAGDFLDLYTGRTA